MTTPEFRQEAADPKPLTRVTLQAAAEKYGVTVSPSMSDRSIAEAIATKLSPGTYNFAGRETDT